MALVLNKPFLQPIHDALFEEKKLSVFVLRDDLIHPFVSGNKWRKLKYNIEEFRKSGREWLVTFGGAFSNHIVATAAAGKESGIKTIGIIRGEELNATANPVLRFATECGMNLIFVSRDEYQKMRLEAGSLKPEKGLSNVLNRFSTFQLSTFNFYVLPEGGSNHLAVKGCKEIIHDIDIDFDFICCACGTGTTLAGIADSLKSDQQAIGISVLQAENSIDETVTKFIGPKDNYKIISDYHAGGYGKYSQELEDFCCSFTKQHNIPVEPVYTGKLVFGIHDMIQKDYFPKGKTIVMVHTGGTAFYKTEPEDLAGCK